MARAKRQAGFTLVELMITISIIGIMAGMLAVALFSAQEAAKAQKTRSLISKLDAIVKAKWDAYRTRRVPIQISLTGPSAITKSQAAKMRLDALHDLMRMEMPDRYSDVVQDGSAFPYTPTTTAAGQQRPGVTITGISFSSAWQGYYRRIKNATTPPTIQNQGAECLYMVVMNGLQEEGDGREVIKPDSIGDTDGDGFLEFLDGWNRPIKFVRWPCGFVSELNNPNAPDPFDPTGVYKGAMIPGFAIYPLIYSAGPDGAFGVIADVDTSTTPPLDYSAKTFYPFQANSSNQMIGTQADIQSELSAGLPSGGWLDNIHNHRITAK